MRSALSVGVKQHRCCEYWRHEHEVDDYRGDVPQRALTAWVGDQRAVPHVQCEDAQPPMPVVLHEHGGVALLGA